MVEKESSENNWFYCGKFLKAPSLESGKIKLLAFWINFYYIASTLYNITITQRARQTGKRRVLPTNGEPL
jgi:hypothetical protein